MAYVGSASEQRDGCFLCSAAAADGETAELVVDRGELTVTLLNRFPYSSGHLMVAPRRHTPDLPSLTDAEGAAAFLATRRALRALIAAMGPDGFNIGINHGLAAGASVEHFHQHVVPRWSGDTNFMPVVGDVKVLPEHIETTAQRLREAFAAL